MDKKKLYIMELLKDLAKLKKIEYKLKIAEDKILVKLWEVINKNGKKQN